MSKSVETLSVSADGTRLLSAEGANSGHETAETAKLWLQGSEYTGNSTWIDHRGSGSFGIFVSSIILDFDLNSLIFSEPDTRLIVATDISPSAMRDMTAEVWVKLAHIIRGGQMWLLSQDNGETTPNFLRSLILFDDRFGSGPALGVGAPYTSSLPRVTVGEWIHIVGVWSGDGGAVIYVNGETQAVNVSSGLTDGLPSFTVGNHPKIDYPIIGWVQSFRIYDTPLSKVQVEKLFYDQSLAPNGDGNGMFRDL